MKDLPKPDPNCPECKGSGVELVYGGHGTVLEFPCSLCQLALYEKGK